MIVNYKNFNLHKLILNSLTLDSFEYCYLCPLLQQTSLYAANSDVIIITQKISQQIENIFHLKVLFQQSLQNSHECIEKEDHIYLFFQFQIFNLENHLKNNENALIEYHQQRIFFEIYIFHVYTFLSFEKYVYEVLKPTIYSIFMEFSQEHSWEQNLFQCIKYILVYKIWKIEYWYSIISQLAFDCKEINIARHFIKMTKLEYNMIFTLINLCKYA